MPINISKFIFLILTTSSINSIYTQDDTLKQQIDSLQYIEKDIFIKNSIVWRIINQKEKAIPYLIDKLDDTTLTNGQYKFFKSNLVVGDIALLILSRITILPYHEITGMQICTPTRQSSFNYISKNRAKFKLQIKNYYKQLILELIQNSKQFIQY